MANTFINPYNFVSSDFKRKSDGSKEKGNLTGVIHCQLITKTPMAIPDVEKKVEDKEVKAHFIYPFYKQDDTYMIPGSSLRGSIRSMYETLTDSCYITADTESAITYRTSDPFDCGLLKKTESGWKLYEADRCIFKVDGKEYRKFNRKNDMKTVPIEELSQYDGKKVSFSLFVDYYGDYEQYSKRGNPVGYYVENFSLDTTKYPEIGYVCVGEQFNSKHFESIFWPAEDYGQWIEVYPCSNLENAVYSLQTILDTYNNESINKNAQNHPFYPNRNYKEAKTGDVFPIWYQIDSRGNAHLSVADIGRSAYTNTMDGLLKYKAPCTNRKDICKACALFGMTGKNNEGENASLGSKVRISDAIYALEGKPNTEKVVLRELASPKSSYLPFYLDKNQRDNNWSDGYDATGANIRGRKFYWHNETDYYKAFKDINGKPIKLERNATMELMPKDNEFLFDVYFDQISDTQLNELLWTLTLGKNDKDDTHCYKIGHGKPIGLGSSKIFVTSMQVRKFTDGSYDVTTSTQEEITQQISNNKVEFGKVNEVLRATDLLTTRGKNVEYPKVVDRQGNIYKESIEHYNGASKANNDYASHQYFKANYSLGDNSPKTVLPNVMSKNLELNHEVSADKNITPEYVSVNQQNRPHNENTHRNHPRNENNHQNNTVTSKTGTIKFYDQREDYGYIKRDDGGRDIRYKASDFKPDELPLLRKGNKVEFTVVRANNETTFTFKIKK